MYKYNIYLIHIYISGPKSGEGGAIKGDGGEGNKKERRNTALRFFQLCHGMKII